MMRNNFSQFCLNDKERKVFLFFLHRKLLILFLIIFLFSFWQVETNGFKALNPKIYDWIDWRPSSCRKALCLVWVNKQLTTKDHRLRILGTLMLIPKNKRWVGLLLNKTWSPSPTGLSFGLSPTGSILLWSGPTGSILLWSGPAGFILLWSGPTGGGEREREGERERDWARNILKVCPCFGQRERD